MAILCVGALFVGTIAWMPRSTRAAMWTGAPTLPLAKTSVLVVHTFNVFGLPWPVGHEVDARCRLLARCLERETPDVVALQEVWDATARTPLLRAGYHAIWCDSLQGLLGQNGLLTLSRHPVVKASSHQFARSTGLESMVGKGALRTVVALPDGRLLAVWNVHLQSGDALEVRTAQIVELAGWIATAADLDRVVLGDFNCGPADPEWALLVERLGALGMQPGSAPVPTYDHGHNPLAAAEPPAALDHVFVPSSWLRGECWSRRIHDRPCAGTFLSDHFGVAVRVSMPPSMATLLLR